MSFVLILYFDWLLGPHKGQNFEKKNIQKSSPQKLLLYNKWMNPVICIHVPDTSLYIICVYLFQSDKNSGCYGFHRLIMGKVEISYFFLDQL